jgi:hypothetical protein
MSKLEKNDSLGAAFEMGDLQRMVVGGSKAFELGI